MIRFCKSRRQDLLHLPCGQWTSRQPPLWDPSQPPSQPPCRHPVLVSTFCCLIGAWLDRRSAAGEFYGVIFDGIESYRGFVYFVDLSCVQIFEDEFYCGEDLVDNDE